MTDAREPRISNETREADRRDARAKSDPDRMPTGEEERMAEKGSQMVPDVSESYKEQAERGANTQGEGRITD